MAMMSPGSSTTQSSAWSRRVSEQRRQGLSWRVVIEPQRRQAQTFSRTSASASSSGSITSSPLRTSARATRSAERRPMPGSRESACVRFSKGFAIAG